MYIYFVCKLSSQKSPFLSINKTTVSPWTSSLNLHGAQSVILSLVKLCNVMQLQEKQKQSPNQNGLSPKIALIWGSTNIWGWLQPEQSVRPRNVQRAQILSAPEWKRISQEEKTELSVSTAETPLPLPVLSVSCRLKYKARSAVHRE